MRIVRSVIILLVILGAGYLVFLLMATPDSGSAPVRTYLRDHGAGDTGALNLVTAIYLGYRAFDTLGETVVLVLAVVGVNLLFVRKR